MSTNSPGGGRTLTDKLDAAFESCIQDAAEQGDYET